MNSSKKSADALCEAIRTKQPIEVVRSMIEARYKLRSTVRVSDPLVAAINRYDPMMLALLLDAGAKLRADEHADRYADVVMSEVEAFPESSRMRLDTIKLLEMLRKHGADSAATNEANRTGLRLAAMYGRQGIVRWMLDHGAKPLVKAPFGKTPREEAEAFLAIQKVRIATDQPPVWGVTVEGLEQTIALLVEAQASAGGMTTATEVSADSILNIPVAQRRGLCDRGLETTEQRMIRGSVDAISDWYAKQPGVVQICRDALRHSELPTNPRFIALFKLKGHDWIYVVNQRRAGRKTAATWVKQLSLPVILVGSNDASGIAFAEFHQSTQPTERVVSTEIDWSNVDEFLKRHEAYLTFPWIEITDGKLLTGSFYDDEGLAENIDRVDLIFLA